MNSDVRKKCFGGAMKASVMLFLAIVALTCFLGCEQELGPGITYHKKIVLFPIFDVEKIEGTDQDGTRWKTEKGDAVAFLSAWEKEERYDKDNFLIYSKKKDAVLWGLFSSDEEETEEFRNKKGNILFWPHESKRLKTVSGEK
jgi:hypothetical protein